MVDPPMTTVELLRQRQALPLQTTATSLAHATVESTKRVLYDVGSTKLQTLQNGIYPTKRRNSGSSDLRSKGENVAPGALGDYLSVSKIHPNQSRSQLPNSKANIIPAKAIEISNLPLSENDLVNPVNIQADGSAILDGNYLQRLSRHTIEKASHHFTSGRILASL